MAIKHEAVVAKGDLLTATMWNAAHIIEDMTIKGIHIDNLQIGTDHLIDDAVTTAKLAIQDYLDLVNRLADPVLAVGRLWFREDLVKLRFSPDGTTVKEIAWAGDLSSHITATPIDHPDLSVTTAKIADGAILEAKIADAAVTTAKLADAAVTPLKLSFGTWEKVAEVVPTANTDIVSITGLDLDADKAYLLILSIKDPTTETVYYRVCVNADYTFTNYYNQRLRVASIEVSAKRENLPCYIGADLGKSTQGHVVITRPAGDKVGFNLVGVRNLTSSIELFLHAAVYNVVANVTQINIYSYGTATAGLVSGIGAGSRIMLFKVSA